MAPRLPAAPFFILGILIICIGLISIFSLFPHAGLDPKDKRSLFVFPAALFLQSTLSFLVAYFFVQGSPIDREYFLTQEILTSLTPIFIMQTVIGVLLAVLCVTLFRKLYPQLPAWLRTETVNLTWKDLRLPGILWAVSVVVGLIILI